MEVEAYYVIQILSTLLVNTNDITLSMFTGHLKYLLAWGGGGYGVETVNKTLLNGNTV